MKSVFKIFRRDLFRLLRNPIAIMVMIGVCILPSLYAWFNIAANIDPYANTKNVKVAVVSDDKGTTLEGKNLNVGSKVIEKVKDNKKLGWVFCTKQEALDMVYAGDVYASIIIPEDFSENFVSFVNGNIETPQIDYYVNEKKNAIAPKITDTGASTVQQQINSTFSGIVSKAVSEVVDSTAGQVKTDLDSTNTDAIAYLDQITNNLGEYETVLTEFNSDIDQSRTDLSATLSNLDQANQTIDDCVAVLDTVTTDLKDIRTAFSDLSTKQNELVSNERKKLSEAYTEIDSSLTNIEDAAISAKTVLSSAVETHQQLLDLEQEKLNNYKSLIETLPDGDLKKQLQDQVDATQSEITREQNNLQSLQAKLDAAQELITTVRNLRTSMHDDIKNKLDDLQSFQTELFFPTINNALDQMSNVSGQLSGVLDGLKPTVSSLKTIVSELSTSLANAQNTFVATKNSLASVKDKLATLRTDLAAMNSSELYKSLENLSGLDADKISQFMTAPVQIDTEIAYKVENYGSAMTPFYTNLAIWVGGLVLASILKSEVDKEKLGKVSEKQKFFGRLLLFLFLGVIQATIVCIGDFALIGTQCLHKGTFILSGIFCSLAYTTFIYAMAVTFKHIGKALCVVLVILQIPGSAGTYPIEMTPHFFQVIHPFLPFTYGVNAMRECIAGYYSSYLANNWIALGLLLILGLIIGLGIRPRIVNVNYMFDKKLQETDLIASEHDEEESQVVLLSMFKLVMNDEVGRAEALKFEQNYHRRVKWGFGLMAVLGLAFLILMFSMNSKIIFLILWIISLVGLSFYLLAIEYIHTKLEYEKEERGDM